LAKLVVQDPMNKTFCKHISDLVQSNINGLNESCIGFHSSFRVYVFFPYIPRYVDLFIGRGVKPLLTTNYLP